MKLLSTFSVLATLSLLSTSSLQAEIIRCPNGQDQIQQPNTIQIGITVQSDQNKAYMFKAPLPPLPTTTLEELKQLLNATPQLKINALNAPFFELLCYYPNLSSIFTAVVEPAKSCRVEGNQFKCEK